MILNVLIFMILFFNMYLSVCMNERFFLDAGERFAAWTKAVLSTAAALLLLLLWILYPTAAFCVLAAIFQLIAVSAISGFLWHPHWKLLLTYACAGLGIVFLADALFYLVFVRYLGLSVILYAGILLLWRIAVSPAVFASKHLTGKIKTWSSYYPTVYGTLAVGFSGIVFLTYFTIVSDRRSTLAAVWAIITAALILRMLLAFRHIKYQREKELLAVIALKNELLEKNYDAVNQAYAVNAGLFHDFHKHLEILRQMADDNQSEEIVSYINNISGPLQEISCTVWTGDKTVDYIINSRQTKAGKCGIHMGMNIEYPYNTDIQSNDLCTILSNLLDNAIEAANRPELTGERFIFLTIRRLRNILVIKLENSSIPPVYSPDGSLQTAKENHSLHGWGMRNIESAVDKYDGIVQTSYRDHIFRTTVTLSFDGVKIK